MTENCLLGDKGVEKRVRCQVQQTKIWQKNCRLGLGSLSGQLGKVGIGRDSFLPLQSIKVARRVANSSNGMQKQFVLHKFES